MDTSAEKFIMNQAILTDFHKRMYMYKVNNLLKKLPHDYFCLLKVKLFVKKNLQEIIFVLGVKRVIPDGKKIVIRKSKFFIKPVFKSQT